MGSSGRLLANDRKALREFRGDTEYSVPAFQLAWPDDDGRWPWDDGFRWGREAQPRPGAWRA